MSASSHLQHDGVTEEDEEEEQHDDEEGDEELECLGPPPV